jgi:hypothetical protein
LRRGGGDGWGGDGITLHLFPAGSVVGHRICRVYGPGHDV